MIPILQIISIVMAIDLDWSDITTPIYEMFMGNDSGLIGIIGGDEVLFGLFIFFLLFVLTLMFGLGMLIGSVVIIPTLFAIFGYVPDLRIIVAILCGLILGLGLHRLVRR